MVAAFETAIAQADGDYPLIVLWSGLSSKDGHGTIVLEWPEKVPQALLHDLHINKEVLDFVLYEDERVIIEHNEEPLPTVQETEMVTQEEDRTRASRAADRPDAHRFTLSTRGE